MFGHVFAAMVDGPSSDPHMAPWLVGAIVVLLILHRKLSVRLYRVREPGCHRRSIEGQLRAGSHKHN